MYESICLRYGVVLFCARLLSFVLEWVYQRWCYPISFSGFFTSLFTQSSVMCTTLREVSGRLESMFLHIVITWFVTNLTKLKRKQSM